MAFERAVLVGESAHGGGSGSWMSKFVKVGMGTLCGVPRGRGARVLTRNCGSKRESVMSLSTLVISALELDVTALVSMNAPKINMLLTIKR